MSKAFKKFASKATDLLGKFSKEKDGNDISRNGGGYHSSFSVSSLPATTVTSYQSVPGTHRRVASVRPLPVIPTASKTLPRDLHRRRPTNGAREMPFELKKVDCTLPCLVKINMSISSKRTGKRGKSCTKRIGR